MSIINNTYQFIFVHIPKCGGTSTTFTLSELTTFNDIELGGTEFGEQMHKLYLGRYGLAKHSTAREIRGVVGHQLWQRYLTFTIVRNPFTRALSSYRYFRTHKDTYAFIRQFEDFDSFVRSGEWEKDGPDRILLPQNNWTRKWARNAASDLDYIGKLEEYEKVMKEIFSLIDLNAAQRKSLAVEKRNTTEPATSTTISQQSVERILNRYDEDFKSLRYKRDLPPELVVDDAL